MTSFDLIDQPWIPVITPDGRREVSLRTALTQAHLLSGLALEDPLAATAILRQVLLPVVLDATGAPRDWDRWAHRWQSGRLDPELVSNYLDQHAARFDLFDATAPFAQVAGLQAVQNQDKPISLLIPAMSTGNNVPLFAARTDGNPPQLTPAQAARAVLSVHCWDTAGIKSGLAGDPEVKAGKTTGNPTGPLGSLGVVVPLGTTLAETICFNLPILTAGLAPGDRPQWRAEPLTSTWQTRSALGLLDLLTWQARRIRLVVESDPSSGLAFCRRVVIGGGDRMAALPQDIEPHTRWRRNPAAKADKPPFSAIRHQVHHMAWQGLSSLLATQEGNDASDEQTTLLLNQLAELRVAGYIPEDLPLQVLSAGIAYGSQSAVVEDVITDVLPLPVAALVADADVRQLLMDVAAQADELRSAANKFGDNLRLAGGGSKLEWNQGQRLGEGLLHGLTPTVIRMLAGLQKSPDLVEEAELAWQQTAREAALALIDPTVAATAPSAFGGRDGAHPVSRVVQFYRSAITKILGAEPATPSSHPVEERQPS